MIRDKFEYETEEERTKCIDSYMRNYHPAGYGTTYSTSEYQKNGQTIYVVRFSRGKSCD